MDYQEKTVLLKNGRTCLLRAPVEGDAEMMLDYLMTTSAETPYMIREPEEVRTDLEEEREFLRKAAEHPRRLMVSAYVEGQLAGTCSFAPASERNRMRHRCRVGISLYRAFWGLGIGTALMGEILAGAKTAGFEQAELEVVSANAPPSGCTKRWALKPRGPSPTPSSTRTGPTGITSLW